MSNSPWKIWVLPFIGLFRCNYCTYLNGGTTESFFKGTCPPFQSMSSGPENWLRSANWVKAHNFPLLWVVSAFCSPTLELFWALLQSQATPSFVVHLSHFMLFFCLSGLVPIMGMMPTLPLMVVFLHPISDIPESSHPIATREPSKIAPALATIGTGPRKSWAS